MQADVQMSDTDKTEGELHYGAVNIIKKTHEAPSLPMQDIEQQETVYAHVKVSTQENPSTQTVDNPENLYAQVKKK